MPVGECETRSGHAGGCRRRTSSGPGISPQAAGNSSPPVQPPAQDQAADNPVPIPEQAQVLLQGQAQPQLAPPAQISPGEHIQSNKNCTCNSGGQETTVNISTNGNSCPSSQPQATSACVFGAVPAVQLI